MLVNLNELIKINYKNTLFSSGIIDSCAKELAKSYGIDNYKQKTMPPSFWSEYNKIEQDYKLINKELYKEQNLSKRQMICHKYHSLQFLWKELVNPSGLYSSMENSQEFESVWQNLCKYYPEMNILSKSEGSFVLKSSYEKFLYNHQYGYPTFESVVNDFSLWIDRGDRFIEASLNMKEIFNRTSKAS